MTYDHSADARTWNQRYVGDEFLFGTTPNEFLADQKGRWVPGARILCVSDGEGRNSVWLARQGLKVDAFDISEVGVAKARRLAEDAGVTVDYRVADCDAFAWPAETYDGVVAIFVQYAAPATRARLFANMIRATKPGGCVVLQGYTPKQLEYGTGGPRDIAHLYTEPLLRDAFAALEIVELRVYEAELSEGARHRGMSALVGMVARRP